MTTPPKAEREAMKRLIELAANLAQRKPLMELSRLEENAGRLLGRMALSRALAQADEAVRLAAIEARTIFDMLSGAAQAASPVPQGWQPIETAPRTGLIDLWTDRRHTGCYWDPICEEYRTINSSGVLIRIRDAKFWMSIPPAPGAADPAPEQPEVKT